jgi:hypothetical protein
MLLNFEARGWVRHTGFAGSAGWSVTDTGRIENERRLAIELERAGARDIVTRVHAQFIPLNRRLGTACTNWQIRPTAADPMVFNDHTDWAWDERILQALASLDRAFRHSCGRLAEYLQRFAGDAGSTPQNSTRVTPFGSSSTKTCSPPSEYNEERTPDADQSY